VDTASASFSAISLIKGLFPANLLPLWVDADAFLRVGPFHGIFYAVGVIKVHQGCLSLGAQLAAIERGVGVPLDFYDDPVDAVDADGAVIETYHARGFNPYIFLTASPINDFFIVLAPAGIFAQL
jgi:hypothetical protein